MAFTDLMIFEFSEANSLLNDLCDLADSDFEINSDK